MPPEEDEIDNSEPPPEIDQGLKHIYAGGKPPKQDSPSIIQRLGEIAGAKPSVSLREVDPSDHTPILKPLVPGDGLARETGKYMVQGMLGQGGVGTVHKAHDTDLGRDVAMKFLHEKYANDASVLHRFVEEAQIGGQLQHPGIVPVYELGMSEGRPFFCMKMVKGQTLAKKLAARTDVANDRRTFLSIFEDICQTMAYAHARGVVHRDLKPANIMIGAFGEVQVVDWGMGKVLQSGGVADEQFATQRQSQLSVIETVRSSGHGTQSVLGSVMGTPAYMAPEQARGDVDAMDERSDVFALGAILCEILTGKPPYVGDQKELIGMAAMAKLDDAHKRLASCGAEKDLLELTTQCLLPAPAARPQSAEAVAKAVQDHLASAEARVHEATVRSLAFKRTQKLGIALTSVIAVALVVSLSFWIDADTQRVNAVEQEKEAATARDTAEMHLANFDRLSLLVRLEDAKAAELELYTSWPHDTDAFSLWLSGDAKTCCESLKGLRTALVNLELRALPQSEAEIVAGRLAHPRPADQVLYELEALRHRLAVHSGTERHVPFTLNLQEVPATVRALNDLAWPMIEPERSKREFFGREAEGLALARHGMTIAPATRRAREDLSDTLAWALFSNGLTTEALEQSKAALAAVSQARRPKFEEYLRKLEGAIAVLSSDATPVAIRRLAAKVASLRSEIDQRRTWTFKAPGDLFLHDTLNKLVEDIKTFEMTRIAAAEQNLRWAGFVEELTITRHQDLWDEAKQAIEQADGVAASRLYAEVPIRLSPQLGLVPIGKNPVTSLWEFYHLRSAWDGRSDPAKIAIPEHRPDGSIDVTGTTGIVFVLLPGGTSTIGAQADDARLSHYDPDCKLDRIRHSPRPVTLDPFFLARHEMTQGQWKRLWSGESLIDPSKYKAGKSGPSGVTFTLSNPVETVSWTMCEGLLRRQGLLLPTHAQWEYGCRGGVTTPWICEKEELRLYANLRAANSLGSRKKEPWTDDYVMASPVGAFRANAFGLHDVIGNVWEWCRDALSNTGRERLGDGLRPQLSTGSSHARMNRGGSFTTTSLRGRLARREDDTPEDRYFDTGLRVSRRMTHR